MEEEGLICRVLVDLETLQANPNTPISEQTLLDLQTLSEDHNHDDAVLFEDLRSRNLSPSNIVRPITAAMESSPTSRLSLLSSKVYLSLLLYPNAPVLTLFTPIAFLSLFRAIRHALKLKKPTKMGSSDEMEAEDSSVANRKRNGCGKRKGLKNCGRSSKNDGGSEEGNFDIRELFSVLEKLRLVLRLVHLARFPDILKGLIQTVAEIPITGLSICRDLKSYEKLGDICVRIFDEIFKADHGDQASNTAEVLKSLTPLIFMVKSQARTFALGFVANRMVPLASEINGVKKAIVNFPKYLAQKAPEKADARALAAEAITEIVKAMEYEDQIGFLDYVIKMAQGKVQLRLLAVDLIPMLPMFLRDSSGVNLDNIVESRCLEALLQRCSDLNAGIRARSLSNMAQLVVHWASDSRGQAVLKEVLGFGNGRSQGDGGGIYNLLSKRCMDEKAAVRKAALLLVSKLTALSGGAVDSVMLKTMGMACSDPLVSIRKAAISALSEAFRAFSDESVSTEWLHSIPRLISDNESSIQEECQSLFLELVLDRISRVESISKSHNVSISCDSNIEENSLQKEIFPHGILGLLKEICNGEVAPWVKKICTGLGKKKRLKPRIAVSLQNIIRASESLWLCHCKPIEKWAAPFGAWFLLSEVSAFLPKSVDWEFLCHHWKLVDKLGVEEEVKSPLMQEDWKEVEEGEPNSVAWAGDRVFLLQTISNVSLELPPEPAADLAHNLLQRIEKFNMHLTEVNAHVKALSTLCKRKASNPEEADILVKKWVLQLLSKASEILKTYMSQHSKASKSSSFLTPSRSCTRKSNGGEALSKAMIAAYTIGSLVIICPTVDLKATIPILHTIITSGSFDPDTDKLPGPRLSVKQTTPALYIQAWLTMGKICLADGKLAKNYIPLFVQELEKSDSAALRNNLVVMMADFCVHYTALVDCYISKITKCLRDPCELVRRQTFILLSRLLQRDYVKWRGVFFLRFLISLVDESEKIRQLADFLFGNILKAKAPLLAYNSFVEAIFVLNDCHIHGVRGESKGSKDDRLFSIRGNDEKSRSKRMHIYVSLLKQMAPEHLLATFAKVCAEILAAASDGMLNTEDVAGQSVLQDAFQILACKEIRIPSNRGLPSESADMDEEVGDGAGSSSAAARGRAVTQAVKKGLIQNTIPIFIELKRLLESKHSPLTGSLMECLRVLLKDYKNEIDEILVADKQLQKELIYDMQKYDAAKAKSAAVENFLSPGVSKVRFSVSKQSESDAKIASAMADVAAASAVRSVLREVNKGTTKTTTTTPPLSCMSVPKLKTSAGGGASSRGERQPEVIESLRRRQSFDACE